MSDSISKYKFAFLVMPDFPMACLTSAIEPLRAANEICGSKIFEWQVVGERTDMVRSSADVRFEPDVSLHDLKSCRALYLLGSPSSRFVDEKSANGVLRSLERRGMIVGAFSGGVFPLARSHLLGGRQCSVHWVYDTAFREQFPNVISTDRMMVFDGPIETASGAAAVFDLMLNHIGRAVDAATVTEVACWFQHPFVRGSEAAQLVPTKRSATTQNMLPDAVQKAISIFSENIEDSIRVQDVAGKINISSRQLDRIFQSSTGLSPLKYYRTMRLEKARQMVLYSSSPISEIALAVGYTSSAPLVRHYRRAFGMSPTEHRQISSQFVPDKFTLSGQ